MTKRLALWTAWILCWACLLLPAAETRAGSPIGGLTVAVTPDGTRLVAGGDSLALYDLDPKTLAVQRRAFFGRQIRALVFSADARRLFVETTNSVHFLAADTLQELKVFENCEQIALATGANLLAVKDVHADAILLLAAADAGVRARVEYGRANLAAFGVSSDGKRIVILHYRRKDESESIVPYQETPKDLKGAGLNEFRQRHDGYTAKYQVIDVASGKTTLEKTLWFSVSGSGSRVFVRGEDVDVITYQNENARIDARGKVTYFELGNRDNWAIAANADASAFLTGGLRDGSRTSAADLKGRAFRIDRHPGVTEYFKGFCLAADGTGFGSTSCWRVVRLGVDGTIEKIAPVF